MHALANVFTASGHCFWKVSVECGDAMVRGRAKHIASYATRTGRGLREEGCLQQTAESEPVKQATLIAVTPLAQAPPVPCLMGADGAILEPCESKQEAKGKRQSQSGQVRRS